MDKYICFNFTLLLFVSFWQTGTNLYEEINNNFMVTNEFLFYAPQIGFFSIFFKLALYIYLKF